MRLINTHTGRRAVLVLIVVMAAVEFVRSSVGTFAVVDGISMCPTLKPNDLVQARISHGGWARGSVVILTDDRGGDAIKRIIALPGETVTLFRGSVFINHLKLLEPYLLRNTYTFKCSEENEQAVSWRLGEDEYFVLGDNRVESCDSRHYGPVKRRQISWTVSLPANAARPELSEIMLSETGEIKVGRSCDRSPDRRQLRNARRMRHNP